MKAIAKNGYMLVEPYEDQKTKSELIEEQTGLIMPKVEKRGRRDQIERHLTVRVLSTSDSERAAKGSIHIIMSHMLEEIEFVFGGEDMKILASPLSAIICELKKA